MPSELVKQLAIKVAKSGRVEALVCDMCGSGIGYIEIDSPQSDSIVICLPCGYEYVSKAKKED